MLDDRGSRHSTATDFAGYLFGFIGMCDHQVRAVESTDNVPRALRSPQRLSLGL